jgi:hypothetical protein
MMVWSRKLEQEVSIDLYQFDWEPGKLNLRNSGNPGDRIDSAIMTITVESNSAKKVVAACRRRSLDVNNLFVTPQPKRRIYYGFMKTRLLHSRPSRFQLTRFGEKEKCYRERPHCHTDSEVCLRLPIPIHQANLDSGSF